MFYSRQLLARKAPLGQIWRAATTHMKIHRRNLNKINIIKICEEILNPPVPMALRLSGILMGGVVLVFQQKVKLFQDDVNTLMVELNRAWKVKPGADPTLLPKGKSQAKKEAITLPENQDTDFGDTEQSLNVSNGNASMSFRQTAYFAMELDSIDDEIINVNFMNQDPSGRAHQAAPEDITIPEPFNQGETLYDGYERFDGRIDEEYDTSGARAEPTVLPSPPASQEEPQRGDDDPAPREEPQRGDDDPAPQEEPQRASETMEENLESHENQMADRREVQQVQRKRKTRRTAGGLNDEEHTVVPAHAYQSWLGDTSDIISKGRERKGKRAKVTLSVKSPCVFGLPSTLLITESLLKSGNTKIYYPSELLESWAQTNERERTTRHDPPEVSGSHIHERQNQRDLMNAYYEEFRSVVGSQSPNFPQMERRRAGFEERPTEDLTAIFGRAGANINDPLATPGNYGHDAMSIPSSGSGHGFPGSVGSGSSTGRSDKKRPFSSSRHSLGSLNPVAEENAFFNNDPNFELHTFSENNGLTLDQELLVETGPTQTPRPVVSQQYDNLTDSIRMQLKSHFDTPGAPKSESLDNLACGMNRKGAAQLFYQTCVLATCGAVKVKQSVAYGEILISKGAKM